MENAMTVSPNAIFIIVTNPLDTMTLAALMTSGLSKNKVIGMGGALDSARFKYFLSQQIQKPISDIDAMVIGGHGDTTMLPLMRMASYRGISVTELLNEAEQTEVIDKTMNGGATLTKLLGTSAWYGPGAAIANVVESILYDRKRLIPCSVFLQGEYGEENICIGVPCIIGKEGVEKIVELKLNKSEKEKFDLSAKSIRETNGELRNILT
jgi:malate dehydrogenase